MKIILDEWENNVLRITVCLVLVCLIVSSIQLEAEAGIQYSRTHIVPWMFKLCNDWFPSVADNMLIRCLVFPIMKICSRGCPVSSSNYAINGFHRIL